jgi:hypothetical protein
MPEGNLLHPNDLSFAISTEALQFYRGAQRRDLQFAPATLPPATLKATP